MKIEKTGFNPDIAKWSYSKIMKIFGENGEKVAAHFGIKKAKAKKEESKDSE